MVPGCAGWAGGSQGSVVRISLPMSQPGRLSNVAPINRPNKSRVNRLCTGPASEIRHAEPNAAVDFERDAGDPFGTDQVFNAFCHLGAGANAPEGMEARDCVVAIFSFFCGKETGPQ